jgi:D-lactate dehydrogenase (cytochrome)
MNFSIFYYSAGYDLTRLLIGSEGTLALITEVTLKLHMIPKYSYAVRIPFSNLEDATKC